MLDPPTTNILPTSKNAEDVPRKLKVYRTPIGFHDAYVAAPSQKAALEAWGSDANLFARGVAEVVTDPALTKEPLARPAKVIKRLRGTAAEQIAALPPNPPPERSKREAKAKPPARRKSTPRPDRSHLEAAEQAIADAEQRHRAEEKLLEDKEAQLARERRDLDRSHETELRRLRAGVDKARRDFERAMDRWQG
jgi:hypothetical protein